MTLFHHGCSKVKEAVDPKALETGMKMDDLQPGQELICYTSRVTSAICEWPRVKVWICGPLCMMWMREQLSHCVNAWATLRLISVWPLVCLFAFTVSLSHQVYGGRRDPKDKRNCGAVSHDHQCQGDKTALTNNLHVKLLYSCWCASIRCASMVNCAHIKHTILYCSMPGCLYIDICEQSKCKKKNQDHLFCALFL